MIQPDAIEAAALLCTAPEPRITVTKALDQYWSLAKEKTLGKSEDQLRTAVQRGLDQDAAARRPCTEGVERPCACFALGMIKTGYRLSEGTALTAETIRLDRDVPHVSIEPEGRQLKSHYARRVIPLTGISLEAFKQHPEGFPHYCNRTTLSAVVNKFLRANGRLGASRHSMYSLRHSFEDRMRTAGIDDRIRRDRFDPRGIDRLCRFGACC